MTPHRTAVRIALGLVTLAGLGVATRVWFAAAGPEVAVAGEPAGPVPGVVQARTDPDSLARVIVTRNPFRVHRTAALVRYSAATAAGVGATPAPATQRPSLVLAGILLGDDPVALIDGLPGHDQTRALRVGESLGGYRLREVSADRAVVEGPDTTYILSVRTRTP